MSQVKVNSISTWTGNDVTIETGKTVSGTASQFKMTDVVQGDVLYGSAADTLSRLAPGTAGQVLQTQGAGANPVWADSTLGKRAVICDQRDSGVAGGTATSGSWEIRTLQTEIYDDIGISIATNVFTLPAGTFYIHWTAPARGVNSHMSRLYDVTNAAVVEYGTTALVAAAPYDNNNTTIGYAKVTPSVATGYRIEHQVYTTVASYGYGYPASYSVEKYTTVEIEQYA